MAIYPASRQPVPSGRVTSRITAARCADVRYCLRASPHDSAVSVSRCGSKRRSARRSAFLTRRSSSTISIASCPFDMSSVDCIRFERGHGVPPENWSTHNDMIRAETWRMRCLGRASIRTRKLLDLCARSKWARRLRISVAAWRDAGDILSVEVEVRRDDRERGAGEAPA